MNLIATVAFGIDMKNKEIYSKFQEMGQRIRGNQRGIKIALQILNCKFELHYSFVMINAIIEI